MSMEREIRVTGKGKLKLKPDTISLLVGLTDQDIDYYESIRKSTEHSQELREAVEALGFHGTELKTLSFRSDTVYVSYQDENDNSWKQRFVGYRVTHEMKLEFPMDNELFGKVLQKVARLSGTPEFHVDYTVKDTDSAKNELLKAAVADSRRKAEVLTEAAGAGLGEILTIDYSWGEIEFVTNPVSRLAEPMMAYDTLTDGIAMDIEPDDIDVEDTVTVVWALQ